MTLERLLTSPSGFGLTTASPLQKAICRASDGLPMGELAADPTVRRALPKPPKRPPTEMLILSAIRTAKSLTASARAVQASQNCDVSKLGPGETPRVSVVAPTMDLARVVFGHLVGNLQARPALAKLLLEPPTADSVMLRHPSGRPVEVKVVAGARAGASLVARWSAGCIFDEAPRMVGQEDGVVNLDDCRAAVLGRLLEGAQIWYIGSPWAPFGPVWEMVQSPSDGLLVVRATGPDMHPAYWTPERCAELKKRDPTVYRTDVEAEFADPETSLLSSADVDACTRKEAHLEPDPLAQYAAAIDPATRGNAWTLVISTVGRDGKARVAFNREWIGSKVAPLKPGAVLAEIADDCRRYRLDEVQSDQWAVDALAELAEQAGLTLIAWRSDARTAWNRYQSFAAKLGERQIELPPDTQMRADLLALRRRITQTGVSIVLPVTSNGRHCDYAPALVLSLARYLEPPSEVAPEKNTKEYWEAIERDEEDAEDAEARAERKRPIWGDRDDDGWDIGA